MILAAVFALHRRSDPLTRNVSERRGNNPQKFSLWTTGKSFTYTFTVDPRAVDVWLFSYGGGATGDWDSRSGWTIQTAPVQGTIPLLTSGSNEHPQPH